MYSPSAGKLWTTDVPPRVPSGAPSTWRIWFTTFGTRYIVIVGATPASPMASRLILPAART